MMLLEDPTPIPQPVARFVAQAVLPTRHGPLRTYAFRDSVDHSEPLALVVGKVRDCGDVLVRVHDACLTSEVLGSLKCDCKQQLDLSLQAIQEVGQGVVLYLPQEGRGIGLSAKIAAYALQSCGLDTVDANRVLGLPDDNRRYDQAASMLEHLGVRSVRLMTNNPRKVELLLNEGVVVRDRIPLVVDDLPELAQHYLDTKVRRMRHMATE